MSKLNFAIVDVDDKSQCVKSHTPRSLWYHQKCPKSASQKMFFHKICLANTERNPSNNEQENKTEIIKLIINTKPSIIPTQTNAKILDFTPEKGSVRITESFKNITK